MDLEAGMRLGMYLEGGGRLFHGVNTSHRDVHCDARCLKGPSIATTVSQGEMLISASF